MNKIIKYFCLATILIASCANPLPPSGGPPDKTPPVIRHTEPKDRALNFNKESVEIDFSKYMNNNSVQENIFISPSVQLKYDWSGKSLEIEFDEALDSNTTYALTLGTDYTDFRGNKPDQAFTLIFSTGSNLDSGRIKGKLYGEDFADVYIFAYNIDKLDEDTLNPAITKAQYRSQPGKDGSFGFNALKDGNYRIFAVKDQYKDELYNEGTDAFGAAVSDINMTQDSIPTLSFKIGGIIDKSGPMLYDVESVYDNKIIAGFDEDIDTSSVKAPAFIVQDSAGSEEIKIVSAYIKPDDPKKVEILLSEVPDTSKVWRLTISDDAENALKDLYGNIIQDTMKSAIFFASAEQDTSLAAILSIPAKDSATNINPLNDMQFVFSKGIDEASFTENLTFIKMDDSSAVEFELVKKADNIFNLMAKKELASEQWYKISFNLKDIKALSGRPMPDSLIQMRFKTLDIRNYSAVSGTVKNIPDSDSSDYYIILKKDKQHYTAKINTDRTWLFDKVPAGEYRIEIFHDSDGNGEYSYGDAFPYQFAEKFMIFDKKLTVKARWSIEDIVLEWK